MSSACFQSEPRSWSASRSSVRLWGGHIREAWLKTHHENHQKFHRSHRERDLKVRGIKSKRKTMLLLLLLIIIIIISLISTVQRIRLLVSENVCQCSTSSGSCSFLKESMEHEQACSSHQPHPHSHERFLHQLVSA